MPAPLPPDPPIQVDLPLVQLLSKADQAVARLDGVALTLPNPDLFVATYVRQEAVLSSQIEGTQSTLDDVLAYELNGAGRALPLDVEEVVNYVRAMNYGLQRLETLPLSLRLIREIHAELMHNVRGGEKRPGEFRLDQNWIGEGRVPITQATFVPPPPADMLQALSNLESYLHEENGLPALIHCAIAHAQFETIHPFLDGNGRVGRLLVTFLLCQRQVLHQPLLYMSAFLKRHRAEYYDRLMAVRLSGDWEAWIAFFLRGALETANEATQTAHRIVLLREEHRRLVLQADLGLQSLRLLDILFERPLVTVRSIGEHLGVSYGTANRLVEAFRSLGLLSEATGRQRNRAFRYSPFLGLFPEATAPVVPAAPPQTTEHPVLP